MVRSRDDRRDFPGFSGVEMTADGPSPVDDMPLRLEWREPSELDENPANWRRHPEVQARAIRELIDDVGWAGVCLWNSRTNRLIDGHLRRRIAIQGGHGKVPVLIGSWTEAQERKILAALDPLGTLAEADSVALSGLLADVEADGAVGDLLAELGANADLEACLLAALDEGGESEDRDGRRGMNQGRARYVKVVVAVADLADVEEALLRTGSANRAEAMLELARSYLQAHPVSA
jgi:hypothetical protein